MKPLDKPPVPNPLKDKRFWLALGGVVLLSVAGTALGEQGVTVLFWTVGGFLLYFLPAWIARKKHNASSIFLINLLFGWTIIGWLVAFSMAESKPAVVQVVSQQPVHTGRVCPFCAEQIQPAAVVCKHCGRDLPTQ